MTGLSIGTQISAVIFVVLLMRKRFLMTSPYFYIALALTLTTITRIDNFLEVIPDIIRTAMLLVASVGMCIGFGKMWFAIKDIKR